MPLWILPQILSCAAQWGLGLSHLCKNKFFLYGRLFSKCCFLAVKLAGDLQCLSGELQNWGNRHEAALWIYGYWSFTGLGWNIEQHSFYFVVHVWGEAGAIHSEAAKAADFAFPGCSGLVEMLCSDLADFCNSISAFVLSVNKSWIFLWGLGVFSEEPWQCKAAVEQRGFLQSCSVMSQLHHGVWERQSVHIWRFGADGSIVHSED